MKRFFNFSILLTVMVLGCTQMAWGTDKYEKAKLNVVAIGAGTVYVRTSTTASDTEKTKEITGDKNKGQEVKTFYLYAQPSSDYVFDAWYDEEGWFVSDKGTAYTRKIKTPTTAESGTNERTFYGKFLPKPSDGITVHCRGVDAAKGTYSVKQGTVTKQVNSSTNVDIASSQLLVFTPTPKPGYVFYRWYKEVNGEREFFSAETPLRITFTEDITIGADFVLETDYANRPATYIRLSNPTMHYSSLKDAITGANSTETIVVVGSGVLNEDVTIPFGMTLLVPFNDQYTCYLDKPLMLCTWKRQSEAGSDSYIHVDQSKIFRELIIGEGKTLTVNGTLSLSAPRQALENGAERTGGTRIFQYYGSINMLANSKIIVKGTSAQQQGKLYCWGRIKGEGHVLAQEHSEIRECFVYTDWRDDSKLSGMPCFPFNQYYVQDILVPLTFSHGATEVLVTTQKGYSGIYPYTGEIKWIGESEGLFRLSTTESTLTKSYVMAKDSLVFDLYDVTMGDTQVTSEGTGLSFGTSNKLFTITNNWILKFQGLNNSINMNFNLAPGAQIVVEKDATLAIASNKTVTLIADEDWGTFAAGNKIIPFFLPEPGKASNAVDYTIVSSKTWGNHKLKAIRTNENMDDARILVNGTLNVVGKLFSTQNKARIYSLGNGQIYFSSTVATKGSTIKYYNADYDATGSTSLTTYPAYLMNGDEETFVTTSGIAKDTKIKYYGSGADGRWGKVSTVKFVDGEDVLLSQDLAEGEVIVAPADPQKDGCVFAGWDDEVSETMPDHDVTYTAQWEAAIVEVTIKDLAVSTDKTNITNTDETTEEATNSNETYTIAENNNITAESVTVNEGAIIEVPASSSVTTSTLALSATPTAIVKDGDDTKSAGASSQITGEGSVALAKDANEVEIGSAYIDIQMDPSGSLDGSKWYAFAVPFVVNSADGVEKINSSTSSLSDAVLNTDYRVYTYSGANRAANGANGSAWVQVSGGNFTPGVFYLATFKDGSCNTFRFTKSSGSALNNAANISVSAYPSTVDAMSAGWNGIANNALQNAQITLSKGGVAQVFNPASSKFETVELGQVSFAVATPFMVQVGAPGTANSSAVQNASAPARMLMANDEHRFGPYTLRIAPEAEYSTDQLFFSASEEASAEYVIGRDLVKMFMGNSTVPQLWINDYNAKLAMNEAVLTSNVAESSLTLYAPKAGEYDIYLRDVPEDATIYLLYQGEPVANLNLGRHTLSLQKGENAQYGIRINAAAKMPGTATSIDEAKVDAADGVQKVLVDDKVYIIRGNQVYSVTGQIVK